MTISTISRRNTWAILIACATSVPGQNPPTKPKVVFVCEHGAAKSILAAAEFARMAKQRGLEFTILSRGTNPDAEIAAGVRQGLKADGMEVSAAKPMKIAAKDLEGATKVITFGPDLSEWLSKNTKALDWSATPSPGKDYGAARDHLRKELETLLNDLQPARTRK